MRVDHKRRGPQATRNQLIAEVDTEWVLPLDDDDELDPECVGRLLGWYEDADIVYPFCRMVGDQSWCPNRLFNPRRLMRLNFIPVTALIRTDTLRMLGGYRNVPLEDWDLYRRAYAHGARFKCLPEVLWSYHREGQNEFQHFSLAA